ncbi:DUF4189 domain-containing protein [Nocardia sp. NPDC055321]
MSWKVAAVAAASTAALSLGAPIAGAATLHGSIAVDTKINGSPRASWGAAWNDRTQVSAEQAALDECGRGTCRTIVSWSNGCGAVVGSEGEAFVSGGSGATPAEAEQNARENAVREHPALFAPKAATGSSAASPGLVPHVIVIKCTD